MIKKREPTWMLRFLPIISAGYDTTAAPMAQAMRKTKVICGKKKLEGESNLRIQKQHINEEGNQKR